MGVADPGGRFDDLFNFAPGQADDARAEIIYG